MAAIKLGSRHLGRLKQRLAGMAAWFALASLLLAGCGGGGGGGLNQSGSTFQSAFTSVAAASPSASVSTSPSPSPSPSGIVPPAGPNSVSGTVTVANKSAAVTVSLFNGKTLAGQQTLIGGGAYNFPSVANGSYTLVVSGSGLRTASDAFAVQNGSKIRGAYTISAMTDTPTMGEAQGALAQTLHLLRGVNGLRAAPLGSQSLIDFNTRQNFVKTTAARAAAVTQSQVIAIPVVGAQNVAVDRTGMAWVSVNDSVTSFPPITATTTGVVQISTSGKVVGQVSTANTANSGGGAVGVDNALDVVVFNIQLGNIGILPGGQSNVASRPVVTTDISFNAFSNQSVPGGGATSQVVAVGSGNQGSPSLAFIGGNGTVTKAALPASIPSTTNLQGVISDATDNSLYISGYISTGINGPATLYHVSADGTTLLENITLGNFKLAFGQNLTRDSAGNFWLINVQNQLVRVSGPVGARTVTVFAAKHFDGTLFGLASAIVADGAGNVWATDQNNNTVTQFDLNANAIATLNTGPAPGSLAVDTNNNIWIVARGQLNGASTAVVNEIVVGGPVPPNTQPQVYVNPDKSIVTVAPGTTTSTFTQNFPGFPYQNITVSLPISQTPPGPTQTIVTQTASSTVSGPTVMTQSAMYDSRGGIYTNNASTADSMTGGVATFLSTLDSQGSGAFAGDFTNGNTANGVFTFVPDGTGRVTLKAKFVELVSRVTWDFTATFNADGSISDFVATNDSTNMTVKASVSKAGAFVADVFDNRNPNFSVAHGTSASGASIVSELISLLLSQVPPPTPASPPIASRIQAGLDIYTGYDTPRVLPLAVPGYTKIQVGGSLGSADIFVPAALTSLPSDYASTLNLIVGSTAQEDFNAIPNLQDFGQTDSNGANVPSGQGSTTGMDLAGSAQGNDISGVTGGSGGFDKGGPTR